MKIINKTILLLLPFCIWNCTTPTTSMMPSKKQYRIVVNHQIDLGQSFDGEKYGYIFAPYNNLIKCIAISYNGIKYDLGVSDNHIIKYITTSDKRFSVDGYKIGDEITKTHTIFGWGHYAKINEEWYAAWFSENRNEKSGKIQWFYKYDFDKPLYEKEYEKSNLLPLCLVDTIRENSRSNCYWVYYNGKQIEKRNYEDGNLRSIVAYNLSDTKDSIIYENGIKCLHYSENDYMAVEPFSFEKYYYSNFDKSLSRNHIYNIIKNHTLLEDVLWSLASIDNEVVLDSARLSQNRIITEEQSGCSIEYKNLDVQCQLYGIFQTYNTEKLKSVKAFIKDGCLTKMMFVGENTNKNVVFEYTNDCLHKEKVYYYNNESGEISCYEEYCFYSRRHDTCD